MAPLVEHEAGPTEFGSVWGCSRALLPVRAHLRLRRLPANLTLLILGLLSGCRRILPTALFHDLLADALIFHDL